MLIVILVIGAVLFSLQLDKQEKQIADMQDELDSKLDSYDDLDCDYLSAKEQAAWDKTHNS